MKFILFVFILVSSLSSTLAVDLKWIKSGATLTYAKYGLSPNSKYFYISSGKLIKIIDLKSGNIVRNYYNNSVYDSDLIFQESDDSFATVSTDTLFHWNLANNTASKAPFNDAVKLYKPLGDFKADISGKFLISQAYEYQKHNYNEYKILLWSLNARKVLKEYVFDNRQDNYALSPGAKYIVTSHFLINTETSQIDTVFSDEHFTQFKFSPDNKYVGGQYIKQGKVFLAVYSLDQKKIIFNKELTDSFYAGAIFDFSSRNTLAYLEQESTVAIYNLRSDKVMKRVDINLLLPTDILLTKDARQLIVAHKKQCWVKVFDLESESYNKDLTTTKTGTDDVKFSPSTKFFVTKNRDGKIHVFRTETGNKVDIFRVDSVSSQISFDKENDIFAFGTEKGTVYTYDCNTKMLDSIYSNNSPTIALDFSNDSKQIACAFKNNVLKIVDIDSKSEKHSFKLDLQVLLVKYDKDSNLLHMILQDSGSRYLSSYFDIKRQEQAKLKKIAKFLYMGKPNSSDRKIKFAENEDLFINHYKIQRIFDQSTISSFKIDGKIEYLFHNAVSPDGSIMAGNILNNHESYELHYIRSSNNDSTISFGCNQDPRIFDYRTKLFMTRLYDISADNKYLIVARQDATIELWEIDPYFSSIDLAKEKVIPFVISPNPVHNYLNLNLASIHISKNTELEIFDYSGNRILTKQIDAGTTETSIDVSLFTAGVYICRINTSKKSYTRKFIKQ